MAQSPAARAETLEQADLIAQLVKYSDRLVVIQADDPDNRRDFVKLVAERLPQDVQLFSLDTGSEAEAPLIGSLIDQLQLSPGIESPRQLVTALHEAFTGNARALAIIEDVDNWYDTDQWTDLLELIRVAHDMSSRHLLFLLTGAPGLEERLMSSVTLGDMQGDIHTATLPAAQPASSENADVAVDADDDAEIVAEPPNPTSTARPQRRPRRFNPTLLVVAAISVLIVTVGGFALLSRSHKEAKPASHEIAIAPDKKVTTVDQTDQSPAHPPHLAAMPTTQSSPSHTAPTQAAGQTEQPSVPEEAQSAKPSPTAPAAPNQTQTGRTATTPKAAPTPKPAEKPTAPPHVASTTPTPQAKPEAKSEQTAKKPQHLATEPKTAHKTAEPKLPTAADNSWYHHKPRARAIVQLGAFNDLKSARSFVNKHARGTLRHDQWHIFTQKPKGKLLYTVTLGDYPSVERARHAIKGLPGSLKKLRPYPRSVGSVQDAIKG